MLFMYNRKHIKENSLNANGFDQQAEILTEVVKKGKFFCHQLTITAEVKKMEKNKIFIIFFQCF